MPDVNSFNFPFDAEELLALEVQQGQDQQDLSMQQEFRQQEVGLQQGTFQQEVKLQKGDYVECEVFSSPDYSQSYDITDSYASERMKFNSRKAIILLLSSLMVF